MSSFAQEAVARDNGPHFVPIAMLPRRGSGPVTVVLVDDDDQVRGFCRSLLTENGFMVLEADNGFEALLTSVQHQGAIDLLKTDLQPFLQREDCANPSHSWNRCAQSHGSGPASASQTAPDRTGAITPVCCGAV